MPTATPARPRSALSRRRPRSRRPLRDSIHRWRTILIGVIGVAIATDYVQTGLKTSIWSPLDYIRQYGAITAVATSYPIPFGAVVTVLLGLAIADIFWEGTATRQHVTRSRDHDHYLREMAAKYALIPLVVGDNLAPEVRLKLKDVFQTLILRRRITDKKTTSTALGEQSEGSTVTSIADALDQSSQRIVVLGVAGSGKTTMLYNMVRTSAERLRARGDTSTLPVYLRLPDVARAFNASGEYIPGKLAEIIREREGFLTDIDAQAKQDQPATATALSPYAEYLEERILAGTTILCLDALDEIDNAKQRMDVTRWIKERLSVQSGGAIIISSRLTDFQSTPFSTAFTQWEVRAIASDARLKLAAALFPPFQAELQITDPRVPQSFVDQLASHPQAASWGGNPLLFTLAAYAYVVTGSLPRVRSELYGAVVDALIRAKDSDNTSERRRVLGELAYAMYTASAQPAAPGNTLRRIGQQAVVTHLGGVYDPPALPDVMAEWVRRPGILEAADNKSLRFRHLTFQEYLLAVALSQRLIKAHLRHDDAMMMNTWLRLTDERNDNLGQWFEPLRLMVGTLCSLQNQLTGSRFARRWLDETFARYQQTDNEQLLGLVLASLVEVEDVAVLGADYGLAAVLTAWTDAVMAAAATPASERYRRLQSQADSIRVIPMSHAAVTARFLTLLATPDVNRQIAALEAIAGLRDQIDIGGIVPLLTGGATPELQRMAALVLLRQGERGQPAVLTALHSDNPQQRQAVATALAEIGEEGRPIFLAALRSPDADVRRLTAQAVGTIDEPTRGDIAHEYSTNPGQPDWALPTLTALTTRDDTSWQTWQLRANVEATFGGKREALRQLTARNAPAPDVAATSTKIMPPVWRDRSRFPERMEKLGFMAYIIDGVQVILAPLATIPAGPFLMGSDKLKDPDAQSDELPQHSVTLGNYDIALHPLTVAEYACFVRATGHREPEGGRGGLLLSLRKRLPRFISRLDYIDPTWQDQLQHLDHPVVNISWHDSVAYSQWLAGVTGEAWRLPTEAEWEKSARGTDGRIYPWGYTWDPQRANTFEKGPDTTTPVGTYPTGISPYGIFDCSGNVWEWCSSGYREYSYDSTSDIYSETSTLPKTLRGGSWNYDSFGARAANRIRYVPDLFYINRGVRLVRGSGSI